MTGLAPVDGLAVLAIMAKALDYAAALVAIGSVLFVVLFAARADGPVLRLARRLVIAAAIVGLAVLAVRFGIRAARISGMGFEGATDLIMLGLAAMNKLRLVPALRADKPGAAQALRRSISCEMRAAVLILLATATITIVTTPPVNL